MATNTLIDTLLSHQTDGATFLTDTSGATLSYGGLRARVAAAAAHLAAAGVVPGDRVLCQIAKSPEGLILYLATVAAGAVFVPLNTAYTAAELDYFLEDAAPSLLVLDDSTRSARTVAEARSVPVASPAELTGPGPVAAPVPRAPDELAAILYTSGTTGRSKGAMLTHANLVSNAEALVSTWHWTTSDRLLHALPIVHTHGLFVATNVTLRAGASMVFLPAFSLDALAERLPACTTLMGVPTFYTRMLTDPRYTRDALAHLRLVISGSAPLLAETYALFAERTGHMILERYGMTETNMITSNPYEGQRRAGTVGLPLPGVDIRIEQPDDEGIGGISVKGPNVTPGYWRNEEKTRESFTTDGWFITGDLGRIDPDGYLWIVGRQKDLVISGGYNIYPKEVEAEIDTLPGVVESAVYGVPHPDLGEAVAAAVVLDGETQTDPDRIIASLSDRIARFKIPRSVVIVSELPRNTMGKVQKALLRDAAAKATS